MHPMYAKTMYARRLCKCSSLSAAFGLPRCLSSSSHQAYLYHSRDRSTSRYSHDVASISIWAPVLSSPFSFQNKNSEVPRGQMRSTLYGVSRAYSSEGDGNDAGGGKQTIVKDAQNTDRNKIQNGKATTEARLCSEHALLCEREQKEWLDSEKLSIESKKKESPFLTKKERFKKQFQRRIVPWEKMTVSWDTFPYYVNEKLKKLLVECTTSHIKHTEYTSYGARLSSSSGRILLRGIPGTELYRERLVRALAHDLQVPLMVLDSRVLASNGFYHEYASESETDDENVESGEESASGFDVENDTANEGDSDEVKPNDSNEDNDDAPTHEILNKIIPINVADFEKVRQEFESESATAASQSDDANSEQQGDRPFRKGDRVKYVGECVKVEVDTRPLSSGECGEVYEVNGEQVAVIMDKISEKDEGNDVPEEHIKPSVYWIDVRDLVHDDAIEAEDWYIAVEALCEVLPNLEPLIVYFRDSSQWLKAVPSSQRRNFVQKLEEMFDQLPGSIILICGQSKSNSGPKGKDKVVVLPQFGHVARLPIPLQRLAEAFRPSRSSKKDELPKIFNNVLCFDPPKDEEAARGFHKQLEEDKQIINTRNNIVELHKVLHEHEMSCSDILNLKSDGVILTRQKAERVVGWARNYYLSSCVLPDVKDERLILPRECLETAISRLKEEETVFRRQSHNLKNIAKDEYESNFISAVVPPGEIGVKFDDIGALEDVKSTLNELVTLPMRRPELFTHGNLLRPCKGILLFGPPGTGKTLLAKALATEAGANFISITGSNLTSKWFGDAEKLTKALFSFASKLAPVIIFVDEIDSLLGARGGSFEHEATRRMRNEFMAAWDGLRSKDSQRIIVLGATNRPFDLDDAVIRRLPRRIYVDLPDAENRKKILKIFLAQESLDLDFDYDVLAEVTEGYSGSDLKNLCIAAAYRPVQELLEEEKKAEVRNTSSLRPLSLDDFKQAKSKVGASVAYDAASINELRKWNEQYGEGGSRKRAPFGFGS